MYTVLCSYIGLRPVLLCTDILFFFNDPPTTEIYTLSLHDALPISVWRRTDGSPYESGTVLEFETAVEVSRKRMGVPDVYLFRKSAPVVYEADRVAEQLEQHQLLQAVWKRWTESTEGYNTAGYQSFE